MSIRTISAGLMMAVCLAGCSTKNPPKANVPALSGDTPPVSLGADTLPADTPDDAAPAVEPTLGTETVSVPPLRPHVAPEPTQTANDQTPHDAAPPRPRPTKPVAAAKPSDTEERPTEVEPVRTEPRPPSLRPMISEGELRRLATLTQSYIERAKRNLGAIQESRLESNERVALQEARSILARAEQLQQSDPALANSLAERAAILSQELSRKQR